MPWIESLRWTSRTEVCDRLAQFLFDTPPTPRPHRRDYTRPALIPERSDVARLLSLIAAPASVPALCRLVSRPGEDQFTRVLALQALARMQAEIPLPELRRWLEDRSLWQETTDYCYLTDLLCLFRSEEARQVALAFLVDWPPRERARLLLDCLRARRAAVAPEIVASLYDAWAGGEHELLDGVIAACDDPHPLNIMIAGQSLDQPRSRTLLLAQWRRAEGEEREALLSLWWRTVGEVPAWVAQNREELAELAHALVLRHAALVEYFGAGGLLSLLEQKERAASRQLLEGPGRLAGTAWSELVRACSLLQRWPDDAADARLASWIACPDLSPRLRGELLRLLWERDPDRGAAVLRLASTRPEFLPVACRFLVKEARRLRASERDFLQWAVAQATDPVVRYYAAEALEHLGEDSPEWRERLEQFARGEDPYLRLRAAAALNRRGDTARIDEVIAAARTAEHACVRAEALCLLAEADVRQHRALLHRAMVEQTARCDYHRHGPYAAFKAAWRSLMRLDPPEALTELIQCYLMLPGLHNTHQLQQVFEALVSAREPAETVGRFFEPRWRRCWGEESQEDWPDLRYALRRSGRGSVVGRQADGAGG